MTLSEHIWRNFKDNAAKGFLITPGTSLTYAEMADGIRHWLKTFDDAGLVPGDRYVLRTDRDAVAIAGFLAGLVDGVVPVLLEGSCPDARLASIVLSVEPELVVSDNSSPRMNPAITSHVLKVSERRVGLRGLLNRKRDADFGLDGPAATRSPHLPSDDGLAYLLFTSGTTAAPSGVQITRSNLAANLNTLTRLAGCSGASRIFNDMILAHADGMIQGPLLTAWTGAALLRAGGFEVQNIEDWLTCIRQFRATHVLAVPTIWAMIDRFAAHDDYFDADECRMLMTVAAKMPQDLWQRIEARFGRPLVSHYGLTETVASALYSGAHPEMGASYSLGRPVDCEARIADGAREGELQLRGANIFPGYWRNSERTQASFTDDGWFRTGDIVEQRKDGNFEMLGRLKTVIMSGGVLIRPDEIDEALLRHPAVVESVTVGAPDDVFGEIGMTGVVLSEDVNEATLAEHLLDHIEPRKVPKRIIKLEQIPRGASGKARLKDLSKLLTELAGNHRELTQSDNTASTVLEIAAKVFRVPVELLSLRTTPDDIVGWDSFTQLNLVLSLEDHFQCRIPAARVSALRQLDDFLGALTDTE